MVKTDIFFYVCAMVSIAMCLTFSEPGTFGLIFAIGLGAFISFRFYKAIHLYRLLDANIAACEHLLKKVKKAYYNPESIKPRWNVAIESVKVTDEGLVISWVEPSKGCGEFVIKPKEKGWALACTGTHELEFYVTIFCELINSRNKVKTTQ